MDFDGHCGLCNEYMPAMMGHMAFEHGYIKGVTAHRDGGLVYKSAGWEYVSEPPEEV